MAREADFDRYEGRYEDLIAESIGFSGREHAFFLEAKASALLDLARRRLGEPGTLRALDVGCGSGLLHPHLDELGTLEGADVSEAMIAEARTRNPRVEYHVADGKRLPSADRVFDLVLAVCVLHHVQPADRAAFVAELKRVTRPGGLVVVLEHNPFNPLTRLAVARCAFDEDAVLLRRGESSRRLRQGGLRPVESRFILFLPWRGRFVARAERLLSPVPLGAQYYVAAHA